MEGWFPFQDGEHTCSRIAEAAESCAQQDDRLPGVLPYDPTARLLRPEATHRKAFLRHALLNVRVDAGREDVPGYGEVSLDILLHGRISENLESEEVPGGGVKRRGRNALSDPVGEGGSPMCMENAQSK